MHNYTLTSIFEIKSLNLGNLKTGLGLMQNSFEEIFNIYIVIKRDK